MVDASEVMVGIAIFGIIISWGTLKQRLITTERKADTLEKNTIHREYCHEAMNGVGKRIEDLQQHLDKQFDLVIEVIKRNGSK